MPEPQNLRATGERIEAEVFVNAAGAWAGEICQDIGMPLPIEPLRRLATSADVDGEERLHSPTQSAGTA